MSAGICCPFLDSLWVQRSRICYPRDGWRVGRKSALQSCSGCFCFPVFTINKSARYGWVMKSEQTMWLGLVDLTASSHLLIHTVFFIHLLKYLLKAHYVPGTPQNSKGTMMSENRHNQVIGLLAWHSLVSNNQSWLLSHFWMSLYN